MEVLDIDNLLWIDEVMDVCGAWTNTSGQFPAFVNLKEKEYFSSKDVTDPEKLKSIIHLKSYSDGNYDYYVLLFEEYAEELVVRVSKS